MVLNEAEHFRRILAGEKSFETRFKLRLGLPPMLVLHPNNELRKAGMCTNIVVKLGKPKQYCSPRAAWNKHGVALGFDHFWQYKAFVNGRMNIILYPISEPEERPDIVWIDGEVTNQGAFLRPQYNGKTIGPGVRFHYADEPPVYGPPGRFTARGKWNGEGLRRLGAPRSRLGQRRPRVQVDAPMRIGGQVFKIPRLSHGLERQCISIAIGANRQFSGCPVSRSLCARASVHIGPGHGWLGLKLLLMRRQSIV